jgi:hypothetical protein
VVVYLTNEHGSIFCGNINTLLLMSSGKGVAGRSNFIFYLSIDFRKAFHSAMEYDWSMNAKEHIK